MAKVILPLGSFGARGQIGKAFVYFPWKGINCVREFVIPANPNTAGQQTQRGYFTFAVDDFHDAEYNALDVTAWRLLAAQAKNPLTYFNAVVRETVDIKVAGKDWMFLSGGVVSDVLATSFTFTIDIPSDELGKLHWGTTPGYMPTTINGVFDTDHYTFSLVNLPSGTRIYFWCENTEADNKGRTGIYLQKTPSA